MLDSTVSIPHESTTTTDLPGKFHLTCAELQVSSYHLFVPQAIADELALSKTYSLACEVVEICTELDQGRFAYHAGDYCGKMLHLAASLILRLDRSTVADQFDRQRGRAAYFAVISFYRKMTVQAEDVFARSAIILTQLWTSESVFVQPDGSHDSFRLLCHTRYAMSSVFDVWWRWRNEFAGQPHPYLRSAGDPGKISLDLHRATVCMLTRVYVASEKTQSALQIDPAAVSANLLDEDYEYDWDALFSGPAEAWDLFNLDTDYLGLDNV